MHTYLDSREDIHFKLLKKLYANNGLELEKLYISGSSEGYKVEIGDKTIYIRPKNYELNVILGTIIGREIIGKTLYKAPLKKVWGFSEEEHIPHMVKAMRAILEEIA